MSPLAPGPLLLDDLLLIRGPVDSEGRVVEEHVHGSGLLDPGGGAGPRQPGLEVGQLPGPRPGGVDHVEPHVDQVGQHVQVGLGPAPASLRRKTSLLRKLGDEDLDVVDRGLVGDVPLPGHLGQVRVVPRQTCSVS